MSTKRIIAASSAMCICLLGACSNQDKEAVQTGASSPEPITLTMYHFSLTLTDQDYETYFEQPLKKKFPNITLQRVKNEKGTANPEELVAAGIKPDIVFAGINGMGAMKAAKLAVNMTDRIKQHKIDLARYEPTAIDLIRAYGDQGEMYGIPLYLNFGALFYNKDIFDKFGQAYPKDGMLWEDVITTGKRLTTLSDGVQYRGLDMGSAAILGSQLSLPFVEPKTYAAAINNDGWKRVMTLLQQATSIPGVLPSPTSYTNTTDFFQKRNLAQYSYYLNGGLSTLEDLDKKGQPVNWDVVSLPSFKEAPNSAYQIDFHNLFLSASSKYPDQAMEVIAYLVSEEHQKLLSSGRISSLTSAELRRNYGKGFKSAAGKNLVGALSTKPAKRPAPSYDIAIDNAATSEIGTAAVEITTKGVDINTALRNAEERANNKIQQILKK